MLPPVFSSCWRHRRLPATLKVRWLSGPSATEVSQAQLPPIPSERMFGLGPRKGGCGRDDFELEDLAASSSTEVNVPESQPPPNSGLEENYFSKTWASRKNLSNEYSPRFAGPQTLPRDGDSTITTRPGHSTDFASSYVPRSWNHNRIWQYASEVPPRSQERFVIASYNILASTYARQQKKMLYGHVPDHLLDWKSRKRKIMFELGLCSPDVICLQEVDRFRDLQEELAFEGYAGLYKVRTGGAPDGCAIFWRKERFKLVQEESLEFSGLGLRDNVAQLCVLQSIVSGPVNRGIATEDRMAGQGQSQCLIVGNIHVLYNPKRGDIKLGQCRTFLEQVHKLSSLWEGAPVVIGGDFNSTPSSAVYDFLATSELELSGLDRCYISGQMKEEASSARTDHIKIASRKARLAREQTMDEELRLDLKEIHETTKKDLGHSNRVTSAMEIVENSLASQVSHEQRSQCKSPVSEVAWKNDGFSGIQGSLAGLPMEEESCCKNSRVLDRHCDQKNDKAVKHVLKEESTLEPAQGALSISKETLADTAVLSKIPVDSFIQSQLPMEDSANFCAASLVCDDFSSTEASSKEAVQFTALIEKGLDQCSNTHALVASKESSCMAELSNSATFESGVTQEESNLVLSDTLDLWGLDFGTDDCSPNQEKLGNNLEQVKNVNNDSAVKHGWDIEHLKTATGHPECTLLRHKLHLHSVYSEVQGRTGTRDAKGEPLITTYHRGFRGTVDYIWRCNGLKPVKVLDTVPVGTLLMNRGLPTKVWGSDHLAIACELAFTPRFAELGSNKTELGT